MENRELLAADLASLGIMQSLESIERKLKSEDNSDTKREEIKNLLNEVEKYLII